MRELIQHAQVRSPEKKRKAKKRGRSRKSEGISLEIFINISEKTQVMLQPVPVKAAVQHSQVRHGQLSPAPSSSNTGTGGVSNILAQHHMSKSHGDQYQTDRGH